MHGGVGFSLMNVTRPLADNEQDKEAYLGLALSAASAALWWGRVASLTVIGPLGVLGAGLLAHALLRKDGKSSPG